MNVTIVFTNWFGNFNYAEINVAGAKQKHTDATDVAHVIVSHEQ